MCEGLGANRIPGKHRGYRGLTQPMGKVSVSGDHAEFSLGQRQSCLLINHQNVGGARSGDGEGVGDGEDEEEAVSATVYAGPVLSVSLKGHASLPQPHDASMPLLYVLEQR